jgi:hypothetical protein
MLDPAFARHPGDDFSATLPHASPLPNPKPHSFLASAHTIPPFQPTTPTRVKAMSTSDRAHHHLHDAKSIVSDKKLTDAAYHALYTAPEFSVRSQQPRPPEPIIVRSTVQQFEDAANDNALVRRAVEAIKAYEDALAGREIALREMRSCLSIDDTNLQNKRSPRNRLDGALRGMLEEKIVTAKNTRYCMDCCQMYVGTKCGECAARLEEGVGSEEEGLR